MTRPSPACAAASSAAVPTTSSRRRGTTPRWRYAASCSCRTIWRMPAAVIDFYQETIDDQPAAVLASVARIGDITRGVLRCAAATGATPLSVADDIVRARIIRRAER